ncbi:hypothetical protein KIPB_017280, partial [Kipferlia bialata]
LCVPHQHRLADA